MIIFDFNRTLYDPEAGAAVPGAIELLGALRARGEVLYLVSRLEPGREDILASLGLEDFFERVSFVHDKEAAIGESMRGSNGVVYVVGDHLHDEIRAGNRHGAKTIWLRRGKFAELKPESLMDVPWRTIEHLGDVLSSLT